jgi:hypothetical protein
MENYYVDIRVSGGKPELQELLELLTKIQILGSIGSNRTIPVTVDGDGSARLRFETTSTENDQIEKIKEFKSIQKFISEVEEGGDISEHYIGE